MTVSAANRGKKAEGLFKDYLNRLCVSQTSAYYRLPDAHAGSLTATLADFLLMHKGKLYIIEVKETKHEYRLTHGNFKPDQVARQRIWRDAGAISLVLIYHSALAKWRGFTIDRFINREGGSWDLRDQEPSSLSQLLE